MDSFKYIVTLEQVENTSGVRATQWRSVTKMNYA